MIAAPESWVVRSFTVAFLGYLGLLLTFHRDLARLSVGVAGIPLFSGEAALCVLILIEFVVVLRARHLSFSINLVDVLVLAYLVVGTGFAIVGLARDFGLAALRDYALVYYSAFYFLARALVGQTGRVRPLVTTFAMGGVLAASVASAQFLMSPTLGDGHGAPGWVALWSWIAVIVLAQRSPAWQQPAKRLGLALALGVCGFAVYLSAYRTMAVVVLAIGLTYVAAWWVPRRRTFRGVVIRVGAWVLALALGIALHATFGGAPPSPATVYGKVTLSEGLRTITNRWALRPLSAQGYLPADAEGLTGQALANKPVLVVRGGLGASYSFRSEAWANAWSRIRQAPLLGIGFGPSAILHSEKLCLLIASPLSNCGSAHNTYLTLAMRMGIPMLGLFLAINALVAARLIRRLRDSNGMNDALQSGFVLGLALVSCALYAGTSLFLESPYLSAPYWVMLGGLTGVMELLPSRTVGHPRGPADSVGA